MAVLRRGAQRGTTGTDSTMVPRFPHRAWSCRRAPPGPGDQAGQPLSAARLLRGGGQGGGGGREGGLEDVAAGRLIWEPLAWHRASAQHVTRPHSRPE